MNSQVAISIKIDVAHDGTELSGVAEEAWPFGWIISMISPFPGLRILVPIKPENRAKSHDVVLKNALVLLFKKADYFLKHRGRIEAVHRELFHKLAEQNAERSKIAWSNKYGRYIDENKRLLSEGRLSPGEYKKRKTAAREEMLSNMTKLQIARSRVRKNHLGGVMSIEDVEVFNRYFSKRSNGNNE